MAGWVRIPRDRLVAALLPGLRSIQAVAAAYLFGSSLGEMRPDSDVDVALVARLDACDFGLVGEVEAVCRPIDGHPVHATVLSQRDTLFSFRVLTEGVRIYCVDPDVLTDLIERVALHYEEVGPAYRRALEEIYG